MKSTSAICAYLLYLGVAAQLFFNIPCFGAGVGQSVALARWEPPQKEKDPVEVKSQDEKNQEPVHQLIEEMEKLRAQLKELTLTIIADQIARQQGSPPLNCTIHNHPSPSATSSDTTTKESPDLFDQIRNLIIDISVWLITSTFSVVREIFNWITNQDWFEIIVMVVCVIFCIAMACANVSEQARNGTGPPALRQNGTSHRQRQDRPFAGVKV